MRECISSSEAKGNGGMQSFSLQNASGGSALLIVLLFGKVHRAENLEKIVVVVGPEAKTRRNVDGLGVFRGFRIVEEGLIAGDEDPIGRIDEIVFIVVTGDQASGTPGVTGQELDDRSKTQIGVGRMNGEDAAR